MLSNGDKRGWIVPKKPVRTVPADAATNVDVLIMEGDSWRKRGRKEERESASVVVDQCRRIARLMHQAQTMAECWFSAISGMLAVAAVLELCCGNKLILRAGGSLLFRRDV
jgi:hypothetical protein